MQLTVEQADRLAQERPPYRWHRPKVSDWNAGNRESTCTWCKAPITRQFADPVWRAACQQCDGTGLIGIDQCNCGPAGLDGYGHERLCGFEPCPAGCWECLHPEAP